MVVGLEGFRCIVPVAVQFRDLDAMRHVNNAVYFSYLENARVAYVQTVAGRAVDLDDLRIVVVEAACRYRSPALLGETLDVGIRVSHMRRSSFAFEYAVCSQADGRLVAEARTVQSAFDHHAGRMIAIAPAFRAQVERYEGRSFDSHTPIPRWER